MPKLIDFLDRILDLLVVLAFSGMVAILAIQIFYRYVLNDPLVWVMPVSLFLFVWAIWLGGSAGIRDESQIKVELAERYLPLRVKRILMPLTSLVCSGFLLMVVYKSLEVVKFQTSAIYDTLPMSRGWLFLVVPAVGSVMFLQYLRVLIRQIRRYYLEEESRY